MRLGSSLSVQPRGGGHQGGDDTSSSYNFPPFAAPPPDLLQGSSCAKDKTHGKQASTQHTKRYHLGSTLRTGDRSRMAPLRPSNQ